ncbi:MAG: hypothetical protein OEU80_15415 [Deltaproteobacteria bacterium]|jgi:hypothetical protein|nr:hypothetical protein [Deltaproteobacteria bacterium]MDH3851535.1 hypothetical protein [Deltaproteobacteria bacterium]MDH3929264.1 hypothetical protein [Deltaproteobacteria bacterium]MDH3950436.1 hypothetical protein [Deltaproteobacteria bacterium]MDH3965074.1 hypothetical protein [Deltaproteobacteria bacterium]
MTIAGALKSVRQSGMVIAWFPYYYDPTNKAGVLYMAGTARQFAGGKHQENES